MLLSCSAAEVFFRGMSIGVVRSLLGNEDRKDVPTCSVDEPNSARDMLVTAVVLSDVGCFGNSEQRADDGESGTGLDISIRRKRSKWLPLKSCHPSHDLLLSRHLPSS